MSGAPTWSGRRAGPALAIGLGWAVFGVLTALVAARWGPLMDLDHRIASGLNGWIAHRPGEVTFWKAVTTALQPATFEVLAVAAAVVIYVRRRAFARPLVLLVAVFGTVGLYDLVKVIVDRPRPVVAVPLIEPTGASYPSGHTMMSAVGLAIAVLACRPLLHSRLRVAAAVGVAVLLAAAVAFSRLVLGAHYLSDVLGGWALALAWLATLAPLARRTLTATGRRAG